MKNKEIKKSPSNIVFQLQHAPQHAPVRVGGRAHDGGAADRAADAAGHRGEAEGGALQLHPSFTLA